METVLTLLILAGLGLLIGAVTLWRRGGAGKKPMLMVVAALVLWGNAAIMLWPTADGRSLVSEAGK